MDATIAKATTGGVLVGTGATVSVGPPVVESFDLFAQVWFLGITGEEISRVVAMIGVLTYFAVNVVSAIRAIIDRWKG